MLISAYDPGRTTGYAQAAFGHERGEDGVFPLLSFFVKQFPNIESVRMCMDTERPTDIIIVEDFIGAGPRTPDAVYTLKLVGLLQYGMPDKVVVMHNPQVRKAFVSEARVLVEAKYKDRHGADALAHILAFRARMQ